ncbi:DUF2848 domain-containing protein [Undibacter mobilis]|uniref:DUF2848 domain-containing protein n=1 Tax=Undibacter mobilis TaxID=2292256 RepID=A0A371BAY6_9BRAD|nr:DUF2848 domain-containing protein [Undibacter mobilis]RDV04563.1 DUF2848 domain-containing protein [Undibacter mobilis]
MSALKSGVRLTFSSEDKGGDISAAVTSLVIAGWTGRDPAAMEAHIVELEKLGVKRPASTPIFYRGAASLLTQAAEIEVVGDRSSGEVEPVIVSLPDGLWLGVGSDHTDRQVETVGITISKQMCAKPVSKRLWRFSDVSGRWDQLLVRSFATRNGKRTLYQEGPLAKMRHPDDLISRYLGAGATLPVGTVMFCGTLAVHGELTGADLFELEIEDPVAKRKITHQYVTHILPIAG